AAHQAAGKGPSRPPPFGSRSEGRKRQGRRALGSHSPPTHSRGAGRIREYLGLQVERLGAAETAEVVGLACVLSLRSGRLLVDAHSADRVYLLAHIGPPRFGPMGHRRLVGPHIVFGISDEPIPAAVGTKENGLIAAKHAGWRELPFDLHPAHRVDRVP